MDNLIFSDGKISKITINRPEKQNALNSETIMEITECVRKASSNKACRSILITGAGNRAFCAGADIGYLAGISKKADAEKFFDIFYKMRNTILESKKLVVAAINGYCLGGGNELALACDMRFASEDAVFGQPEVKLGIVPGGGATYSLAGIVGIGKAKEMILLGETLGAEEALRIGLINGVFKKNMLIDSTMQICRSINECGPHAVALAKHAIDSAYAVDYRHEKRAFIESVTSREGKNGINAFLGRRKADF